MVTVNTNMKRYCGSWRDSGFTGMRQQVRISRKVMSVWSSYFRKWEGKCKDCQGAPEATWRRGSMNSLWLQSAWLHTFLEKHCTAWYKSGGGRCLEWPSVTLWFIIRDTSLVFLPSSINRTPETLVISQVLNSPGATKASFIMLMRWFSEPAYK